MDERDGAVKALSEERTGETAGAHRDGLPRIVAIDGLRGLAALGVAAFHIYSQNLSEESRQIFSHMIHLLLMWGRWGVQLFFLISGFVIFYTLYNNTKFNRVSDIYYYFFRRIVRLDILYIFVLVLFLFFRANFPDYDGAGAGAPIHSSDLNFSSILKNIFYFLPIQSALWVPVAWTLAIEVQFYIAISILFVTMNALKLSSLQKKGVIIAITLASFIYPAGLIETPIGFWLAPSLFNLLGGAFVYFLFFQPDRLIYIFNILYAFLLAIIYIFTYQSHILATLAGYILMVLSLYFITGSIWKIYFFKFLGERSYSIYLIHQLVGFLFVHRIDVMSSYIFSKSLNGYFTLISSLLIVILISHLLYLLIERPSIKLSRTIARRS